MNILAGCTTTIFKNGTPNAWVKFHLQKKKMYQSFESCNHPEAFLSKPIILYSHVEILAIKMPVPGAPLSFVSAATKDRRFYTYISPTHLTHSSLSSHDHTSLTHLFASIKNTLGCTLLGFTQPTSRALPISPSLRQRELVYHDGACIDTAQVGVSLAGPLESLIKQSNLRSLREEIFMTCQRLMMVSSNGVCTPTRYDTIPVLLCVRVVPVFRKI